MGLLILALVLQDPAALVEKLRSEKLEERDEASRQLKALGSAAIPALERATRDADAEVAGKARDLLRVIPVIVSLTPRLLKTFPGIEDRLSAGGDASWTEAFLEATAEDERDRRRFPDLRREDLDALVARALRGATTQETTERVCEVAAWRSLRSAIPGMTPLLGAPGTQSRWNVAAHLATIRAREAVPEVLKLLDSGSAEIRRVALSALNRLGSKEVVAEIAKRLEDPDQNVRMMAADSIIRMGANDHFRGAVRIIGEVGARAGWRHMPSFQGLDEKAVLPDLLDILRRKDESSRIAAMDVLGRLRASDSAPEVAKLLADVSAQVRSRAAWALGRMGIAEATPQIQPLLRDPQAQVRQEAAIALARLRAREAIGGILELLEDGTPHTRESAADALALMKDRAAVPALLKMLDDVDGDARRSAATALAALDAKEAIPPLARLLKDADSSARFGAVHALGLLGAKERAPEMAALLDDKEGYVRHRAAMEFCRLGLSEGVAVLLGEEMYNWLNALRCPEEWRRLDALEAPTPLAGTSREILEALARHAGRKLECPADPSIDGWWMRLTWDSMKLLDALQEAAGIGFRVVLEPDRIRVLAADDALDLWRAWAKRK